jgi:HEPN domain-containing protein
MKNIVDEWFFKVKGDFNSAKLLFDGGEWDNCCYHSQQTAEKSIYCT